MKEENKNIKPWERQKGEGAKAFEAFKIYRDLGDKRTVSAVVKELGKSRSLIDRWSKNWDWEERTRAYDNELEKAVRAKVIKDYEKLIKRQITLSAKLQIKALEALNRLNVEDMSPKDIKEFARAATEVGRLNRTITGNGENQKDETEAVKINIYMPAKESEEND